MRIKEKHANRWFVLVALILIVGVCHATTQTRTLDYKFIVWGDSQFQNPEVFERIVRETELLKPSFVMHVGDMIHGYTYDPDVARRQWKRFKTQISPLTAPFYPTPGNHDVTTIEIEPVYGEVWGNDRYYYSFDYENAHCIILDTYLNEQYDTIPEKEMEWFKQDLEKNKDATHIFIIFHSPLHLSTEYDWEPVHDLLTSYPVRAVFTGHSHIYDHRVRDGINYFCLNSSGFMTTYNHLLGRSHHYLIASVKGADVSFCVFADGIVYPPDAVPPDTYKHTGKYLEEDHTILIPDISENPVMQSVEIPLENKTGESRSFLLEWETQDFRWEFEPWGATLSLAPGEKKTEQFLISGPQGEFTRHELPALRIDSPFTNEKGWETTLTYYYRLFYPPSTTALSIEGSLNFDGKIDDILWQDVPEISTLYVDEEGTAAPEKTIVKVVYDKEHLYVGIEGEEPNPAGLTAAAHGDLPLIFGDDDFELFFDTNRDLSTFYRLMANPKGTILCSGPDGLFSFKFDVKTYVGDNFWSAEFKIPFSELKTAPPRTGDEWGFNVRRHRQQATPAQRDWSKMRNFPYQPHYFGLLTFE